MNDDDYARTALALYEATDNPGPLAAQLAEALRTEMSRWAKARAEAVDYAIQAEDLESIVRDLATAGFDECVFCPATSGRLADHIEDCLYRRAREWVDQHPTEETE